MAARASTSDERLSSSITNDPEPMDVSSGAKEKTKFKPFTTEQTPQWCRKKRIDPAGACAWVIDIPDSSKTEEADLKDKIKIAISASDSPLRPTALEGFSELSKLLYSSSSSTAAFARNEAIQARVVQKLLAYLYGESNIEDIYVGVHLLANLAAGTSAHTQVLISWNVHGYLDGLLSAPHMQPLHKFANYALGNIGADDGEFRNVLSREGTGIQKRRLENLQSTQDVSIIKSGLFCLSRLGYSIQAEDYTNIRSTLSRILRLLKDDSDKDDSDRCFDDIFQLFQKSTILQSYTDNDTVDSVLDLLVQIVVRGKGKIQVRHDSSLLPDLCRWLHRDLFTEKILSLITCILTSGYNLHPVIHDGILALLIEIVTSETAGCRQEAALALNRATAVGERAQFKFMSNSGWIKSICDLLNKTTDIRLLRHGLFIIHNILRAGMLKARKHVKIENGCTVRYVDESEPWHDMNCYAEEVINCNGQIIIEQLQRHEDVSVIIRDTANHILRCRCKEGYRCTPCSSRIPLEPEKIVRKQNVCQQ